MQARDFYFRSRKEIGTNNSYAARKLRMQSMQGHEVRPISLSREKQHNISRVIPDQIEDIEEFEQEIE